MHEYQLTKQIIQTVEKFARENGGTKVKTIHLVVGEYSGCVAESIELYFDIISAGSICDKADLDIERVRPMLKCKVCGRLFERIPFSFACSVPGCKGDGEPTEIGREFYIHSIEIE